MKKASMSISEAKEKIMSLKGKKVKAIVNKGRKKTEKYSGFVSDTFPVRFYFYSYRRQRRFHASYAYSDVVCGNVKFRE